MGKAGYHSTHISAAPNTCMHVAFWWDQQRTGNWTSQHIFNYIILWLHCSLIISMNVWSTWSTHFPGGPGSPALKNGDLAPSALAEHVFLSYHQVVDLSKAMTPTPTPRLAASEYGCRRIFGPPAVRLSYSTHHKSGNINKKLVENR